MSVEQKSILLWLRDTIPSIRGKIFSILDVELDLETEHSEMIHAYLEYKSTILPTQNEIIRSIIMNETYRPFRKRSGNSTRSIHHLNRNEDFKGYSITYFYGKYIYHNELYFMVILDNKICVCSKYIERPLPVDPDNILLDILDILDYFKQKSLENNSWYKMYNPNYVSEMSIRYVDSILDSMELYLKISYLYMCVMRLNYTLDIDDICATIEQYNKLYNIVVKYIKNNS